MSLDDPRLQELIQLDLDGELTPADKAELARLLLQDPRARRLHDEQRQTDALLRSLPPAEPPTGLRQSILESLHLSQKVGQGSGGGAPLLRYAAAVVGGLLVLGLGYRLAQDEHRLETLQGSVTALMPSRAPLDEVVLHADGAEVSAKLFRDGDGSRLEISSSALRPVEIVLRYDAAAVQGQPGPEGTAAPASGERRFMLTPAQPGATAQIPGTGAIRLEARAAGQRLDTATLDSSHTR